MSFTEFLVAMYGYDLERSIQLMLAYLEKGFIRAEIKGIHIYKYCAPFTNTTHCLRADQLKRKSEILKRKSEPCPLLSVDQVFEVFFDVFPGYFRYYFCYGRKHADTSPMSHTGRVPLQFER